VNDDVDDSTNMMIDVQAHRKKVEKNERRYSLQPSYSHTIHIGPDR
jgi:hypothetical protein